MNIICPLVGKAQRFIDAGYTQPKPLIWAGNKHIIDLAISSLDINRDDTLTFVVRADHVFDFDIDNILRKKFKDLCKVNIIILSEMTKGSPFTVEKGINDRNEPIVIYTPDIFFEPKFSFKNLKYDGHLLTFKANSSAHSYCSVNGSFVEEVAEKRVISQWANVGVYYFRTGHIFLDALYNSKIEDITVNGEYYIAPLYNYLFQQEMKVTHSWIDNVYVLGTPGDLEFYNKHTFKWFKNKLNVGLFCDHSGFTTKEKIQSWINQTHRPQKIGSVIDFGCYSLSPCDYSDYVKQVTKAINEGIIDIAIGSCRSGQGICICANKQPGIYAGLVYDDNTAKKAVEHNCCNVFCLPELDQKRVDDILYNIFTSKFSGGRHQSRVLKI